MLPDFIIEKINEEDRKRKEIGRSGEQLRIEIPQYKPMYQNEDLDDPDRGVYEVQICEPNNDYVINYQ